MIFLFLAVILILLLALICGEVYTALQITDIRRQISGAKTADEAQAEPVYGDNDGEAEKQRRLKKEQLKNFLEFSG